MVAFPWTTCTTAMWARGRGRHVSLRYKFNLGRLTGWQAIHYGTSHSLLLFYPCPSLPLSLFLLSLFLPFLYFSPSLFTPFWFPTPILALPCPSLPLSLSLSLFSLLFPLPLLPRHLFTHTPLTSILTYSVLSSPSPCPSLSSFPISPYTQSLSLFPPSIQTSHFPSHLYPSLFHSLPPSLPLSLPPSLTVTERRRVYLILACVA